MTWEYMFPVYAMGAFGYGMMGLCLMIAMDEYGETTGVQNATRMLFWPVIVAAVVVKYAPDVTRDVGLTVARIMRGDKGAE